MEKLQDYLTKEGWQRDLEQTRLDFNLSSKRNLSYILKNESGNASTALMYTTTGLALSTVGLTTKNPILSGAGVLFTLAGLIGTYTINKSNKDKPEE